MDESNSILEKKTKKNPRQKSIVGKEELLFSGFFGIAQELLLVLDDKGYIKSVNQSGAKHLEYSDKEIIGMHFTELVDPKQFKNFAAQFDEIIKKGEGNLKVNLQSKLGFSQQFNLNVKVLYDENSKIESLLISGVNIEEIKRYEKEILELYPKLHELQRILQIENQRAYLPKFMLKELDKLRSTFISNISHELRTPLASIIGFAENIYSDPNLPVETIKEFTSIILNEGKRLARLVNNILDLSIMQQGKFILNKTKFNLIREINKIIEEMSNSASEKNITITFETNKPEIEIDADEARLMRTIASIIHNAIKYTENSGRVFIQVKELYKEIDIIIIDTGIGINPDEIPNIFKKLTDEKIIFSENNISGFSLVYAKQIIELHRGIIDIQSELNKGTTVLIRLPKQSL
jgi:PAS domain S-box-containing protein